MTRLAKLQFLGPASLLVTVGAAELAAFALSCMPTSETLWYVNLKIFQVFQVSSFTLHPPFDFSYSQLFLIALPIFAIAAYGLANRRPFALALASHLSFIYVGYLVCGLLGSPTYPLTASLTSFAVANSPNIYLPLFLTGACMISFFISHYQYLLRFFYTSKFQVQTAYRNA
jgi:hypothetical protein